MLEMPHLGLEKALKSTNFKGLCPLDPIRFRLGRYAPSQRSQTYRVALELQILFVLALLIN